MLFLGASFLFAALVAGLLIGLLISGCTIAPKAIVPTTATPGANGQANSGVLAPETRNGVAGWKVDATIPAAYAALLPKYGARLDTPPLPADAAFSADGDGNFWCSNLTLYQYGLMHFFHLQDAGLPGG